MEKLIHFPQKLIFLRSDSSDFLQASLVPTNFRILIVPSKELVKNPLSVIAGVFPPLKSVGLIAANPWLCAYDSKLVIVSQCPVGDSSTISPVVIFHFLKMASDPTLKNEFIGSVTSLDKLTDPTARSCIFALWRIDADGSLTILQPLLRLSFLPGCSVALVSERDRKSQVAIDPSAAALTMWGSVLEPTKRSDMGDWWFLRIKRGELRTRASHSATERSVEAETIVFGPQYWTFVIQPKWPDNLWIHLPPLVARSQTRIVRSAPPLIRWSPCHAVLMQIMRPAWPLSVLRASPPRPENDQPPIFPQTKLYFECCKHTEIQY